MSEVKGMDEFELAREIGEMCANKWGDAVTSKEQIKFIAAFSLLARAMVQHAFKTDESEIIELAKGMADAAKYGQISNQNLWCACLMYSASTVGILSNEFDEDLH